MGTWRAWRLPALFVALTAALLLALLLASRHPGLGKLLQLQWRSAVIDSARLPPAAFATVPATNASVQLREFEAAGVNFAIPITPFTCEGVKVHDSFAPWPRDDSVDAMLSAALAHQRGAADAHILDAWPSATHDVLAALASGTGVQVTGRRSVNGSLLPLATRTWASLTSRDACTVYRMGGQYSAAQLVSGRAMEYAGHAQRRTTAAAAAPDMLLLPFDVSQVQSSLLAHCVRDYALRAAHAAGVCAARVVFLNSRVTRDIMMESPFAPSSMVLLHHPLLRYAVWVSQEGHAPHAWNNTMPHLRQLDVPYASALHASAACASQPWPARVPRSVERPVRIVVAAGARARNAWRTSIIRHVSACALFTTRPPGACAFVAVNGASRISISAAQLMYGLSVFCVQPPGDTPMRRAFYDSIQMGCIPVMVKAPHNDFSNPWHLANDGVIDYDPAMVWLSEEDVTSGAFVSVLLSMPDDVLAAKQDAVMRLAFATQYREANSSRSYSEAVADRRMDAVDALLSSLARVHTSTPACEASAAHGIPYDETPPSALQRLLRGWR